MPESVRADLYDAQEESALSQRREAIPAGAEVNEPSSPLLLLKNKRATIGKSSVKVVGPHV
jgi:hypothetical protein